MGPPEYFMLQTRTKIQLTKKMPCALVARAHLSLVLAGMQPALKHPVREIALVTPCANATLYSPISISKVRM
jgi:hypothetical protein